MGSAVELLNDDHHTAVGFVASDVFWVDGARAGVEDGLGVTTAFAAELVSADAALGQVGANGVGACGREAQVAVGVAQGVGVAHDVDAGFVKVAVLLFEFDREGVEGGAAFGRDAVDVGFAKAKEGVGGQGDVFGFEHNGGHDGLGGHGALDAFGGVGHAAGDVNLAAGALEFFAGDGVDHGGDDGGVGAVALQTQVEVVGGFGVETEAALGVDGVLIRFNDVGGQAEFAGFDANFREGAALQRSVVLPVDGEVGHAFASVGGGTVEGDAHGFGAELFGRDVGAA